MIIAWVVVLLIGALACVFAWLTQRNAHLPKEKPGKHWVPTAAEVVGETDDKHPIVRFAPPGREGTSDLPAALHQRVGQGKNLLVLLDPLNPVLPYQMNEWNRLKKLVQITAIIGVALVLVGLGGLVLMIVR